MTELSIAKPHHPVTLWFPGLLLTAAIAAAASWLAQQPVVAAAGLGSLTLAIMLGILVGNSVYTPLASRCAARPRCTARSARRSVCWL